MTDMHPSMKRLYDAAAELTPPIKGQSALARATGHSPQTLKNWESRDSGVSALGAIDIQDRLGISSTWVMKGVKPAIVGGPVSASEIAPGYIRFQLLDGAASGGYGAMNEDFPEVVKELDLAEWQVRKQLGFIPEEGRVALITVRGDSMYPDINNGDVMMVDTRLTHFDGDGVYLINLHGQTFVKRLQMMRDGLHVKSTNKKYESFVVPPDELDTLYVCGRIAGAALMRSGSEL